MGRRGRRRCPVRRLQPQWAFGYHDSPRGWPAAGLLRLQAFQVVLDRGGLDPQERICRYAGTPLYPFGYGLEYTHFQYSNLRADPPEIERNGNTQVSVDVANTGKRAGVETVQLYIHERFTPVATPVKLLRGFERVPLEPGEKKTVSFRLGPEDLQLLDRDMHWVVVPGTFDIMVGKSSAEITSKATLRVQ